MPQQESIPGFSIDEVSTQLTVFRAGSGSGLQAEEQDNGLFTLSGTFPDPAPAEGVGLPFVDVAITQEFNVDVDGAPNAYAPPGTGPTLDNEANAHKGGKLSGAVVGYVVNPNGTKPVQGANDPFPGYYISQTAFSDQGNKHDLDPTKYVDASKINYVVRGTAAIQNRVKLGDFVAVYSIGKDKAVFGNAGDDFNPGGSEGSLALVQALGYTDIVSGKTGSVPANDLIVRYFPGSNPQGTFFKAQADIDAHAAQLGLSADFSGHLS